MSLYILLFCQYWAQWYIVFTVALNCWNNLHIISLSVRNISVAWYFVRKALSGAAVTSHSDLPSSVIGTFFFTNELSSYICKMLAILDFVFQFFALRSLLIMPLCVARLPLLCRSSLLILLIIPQTLLLFQLYYSCLVDCARGV